MGVKKDTNTTTPSETIKLTSDDWTEAMNNMNAAIEAYNVTAAVKCNYRYAINTDSATKENRPLR